MAIRYQLILMYRSDSYMTGFHDVNGQIKLECQWHIAQTVCVVVTLERHARVSNNMERLDLVVLGATGFTGKYVIKELLLSKYEECERLRWGVAGRSVNKLQELLLEMKTMGGDITNVSIIQCDIKDEKSLNSLTQKTKVLLNSTGPYTELGDNVVKSCIETGTHCVDISAEVHYMLNTYTKYNAAAEEANVLIVMACGYGSIPSDIGFIHLQKRFKGSLETVECYTKLELPIRAYFPGCNNTLVHYGTWASLVHELHNFKDCRLAKQSMYPEPLCGPEPPEIKRSFFHRRNGQLWFPYPGPDSELVDCTQRFLLGKKGIKPSHFKIYTTMPLLIHVLLIVPVFFIYYWLSIFGWFRKLLWKFPRFFTLNYMSHKGPTDNIMNKVKFNFILNGKSVEGQSSTLKVSGEHPYRCTAIVFLLSGLTVLNDRSEMPKGGVLSPGAAFYSTDLENKLSKSCLKFEYS